MTPVDPSSSRNGTGRPVAPVGGEMPAEDEISLADLFATLLKGKWIILGSFLVVLTLVALYTFTRDPLYESSSLLYVSNQSSTPQLSEVLGLDVNNRNINNEIEILKSRTIAQRVAERLETLREVPATGEPISVLYESDGDARPEREVVETLRGDMVSISPVSRDVDMINVRVRSTVPSEAALIADLFAEEYVAYNRREARGRFRAAREFLDQQVSRLDSLNAATDQDFISLQNQEGIVAPELEAQQLYLQISDLQRRRVELQLLLEAAQAEIDAREAELDRVRPGLAARIASTDDAIISTLKGQVADKQRELDAIYARNPAIRTQEPPPQDVRVLRNELTALQREIDQRSAELARTLLEGGALISPQTGVAPSTSYGPIQEITQQLIARRAEAAGLAASLGVVERSINSFQGQLNRLPNQNVLIERLNRNREIGQEAYLAYQQQLQQARAAEQSEIGYVTIVDTAIIPDEDEPVSPRVPLNLLMGTILGLMAGVGLALLRSALDNRVRRPEDLRRKGYAVMSVVPDMRRVIKLDFDGRERVTVDGHSYSTSLITLLNPLSPIAEAYRKLRTNIQFSRPDAPIQVLALTSPGPGEGKSVTAMNLAVSMAQSGRRTLYVDADLRRPSGHKLMGVPREPGLVDLLFESTFGSFEGYRTETDNLYVLPAGGRSSNPSELLGSRRMRDLLAHVRREFDMVIVDTSPVLAVTDSQIIGTMADATLLVTSAAETTLPALDRSVEALRDIGAEIVGVVLNRFDAQAAYGGYGSGYGYGYGYGYGEYGEQAPSDPAFT